MTVRVYSRHVWGGQVHKHGGLGYAHPENFWNLEAKRLPLKPFLSQCDAPQRPDRSLISVATPFADEACKTIIVRLVISSNGRGSLLNCSK